MSHSDLVVITWFLFGLLLGVLVTWWLKPPAAARSPVVTLQLPDRPMRIQTVEYDTDHKGVMQIVRTSDTSVAFEAASRGPR
jgi:hypothetical protein